MCIKITRMHSLKQTAVVLISRRGPSGPPVQMLHVVSSQLSANIQTPTKQSKDSQNIVYLGFMEQRSLASWQSKSFERSVLVPRCYIMHRKTMTSCLNCTCVAHSWCNWRWKALSESKQQQQRVKNTIISSKSSLSDTIRLLAANLLEMLPSSKQPCGIKMEWVELRA